MTDDQALQLIAANTRRLRAAKGLSMSALARAIGEYPMTIKRIEDGSNMPGLGLVTRLAKAFEVTVDALLSDPKSGSMPKAS